MANPTPPGAATPLEAEPTLEALFDRLIGLGPFRIIHQVGPSTFEAIARIVPMTVVGPFLNVICDDYHWHLKLDGIGHAQSFDQTHARSGRRVLFLALADRAPGEGGEVFTRLYVHRAKGAEFDPDVLEGFLALHGRLKGGVTLAAPEPTSDR